MKYPRNIIVCGSVFAAFGFAGGILYDLHRAIPLAICFAFGALFCCGKALEAELINTGTEPKPAKRWGDSIIAFALLFCSLLCWLEWGKSALPSPSRPSLELGFALSESKGFPLMLTDPRFDFSSRLNRVAIEDEEVKGFVIVPVVPGTTNIKAEFVLKNISSNEIKQGTIKVTVLKSLKLKFNPPWFEDRLSDSPDWITCDCPIPDMLPGNFATVPNLVVDENWMTGQRTAIGVTPKEVNAQLWDLRLQPVQFGYQAEPFTAFPQMTKDKDGKLQWQLEGHIVVDMTTRRAVITDKSSSGPMQPSLAKKSKNNPDNVVATILLFSVVAILIISIIVYAIRA
ncbi:MAG: hypothetical protein ABSH38_00475 [Verrucomicrobiota bacterium]|jgi:hypothetical protein